jgi:hypothetical protein
MRRLCYAGVAGGVYRSEQGSMTEAGHCQRHSVYSSIWAVCLVEVQRQRLDPSLVLGLNELGGLDWEGTEEGGRVLWKTLFRGPVHAQDCRAWNSVDDGRQEWVSATVYNVTCFSKVTAMFSGQPGGSHNFCVANNHTVSTCWVVGKAH